jgi:amino acid permease
MERIPSFIPERARRIPSLELLVPAPGSDLRQSSLISATFNMIATIVGGGVLSIPFAFEQAGIVGGTLLMILAAVITDFSLYILCSCSRRTGASSYGGVALCAFGPGMEFVTTIALLVYLLFVLVGYMVLVADICAPVIMILITGEDVQAASVFVLGFSARNIILFVLLLILMPLLLKKDLHSLRHTCYIGFGAICVLCAGMAYRAYECNSFTGIHNFRKDVRYMPESIAGCLYAFPIIGLAFLSQFNVISVHCALVDPTRRRVRRVIDDAILLSLVLMYVFGLAGYLYAYDKTEGNILLNFDASDKVIFLGRAACGVAMMFVVPLSLLPCRAALLELPLQLMTFSDAKQAHKEIEEQTDNMEREGTPLLSQKFTPKKVPQGTAATSEQKRMMIQSQTTHVMATVFIIGTSYLVATTVQGVEVVWGIVGSSLAFFVAFMLPAASYIKLRGKRKGYFNKRILSAWGLLVFSIVGAIMCTWQNVKSLL